jgi:pectin methylesterase-like acyl-CoA thioesterase
VSANGVTLRNLTMENDAGPRERVEQAVALHIAGDRCAVYGCALVAHQDTLLLAPEGGDIANAGPCGRRALSFGLPYPGKRGFHFRQLRGVV